MMTLFDMSPVRNITLVIPTLEAAGAERVVSDHSNHWANKGWDITIITYMLPSQRVFYELHPEVKVVNVDFGEGSSGILDGLRKNIERNNRMRKAIIDSSPDVVISHLNIVNVRVLLATRGTGIPVIVTEHAWPPLCDIGPVWSSLRTLTYPWADAITAPNKRILDYFPERIRRNSIAIPNPVRVADGNDTFNGLTLPDTFNIVSIGRLEREKRFDLLLKAFASLPSQEMCHLTIVGEGGLRDQLTKLAENPGILPRVSFPGVIRNPWSSLKNAGLFVLSSEYEGFGLVLAEAMACGLPVISFDCPVGPSDIIKHGVDGVLVPPLNEVALSTAMERLINDESERKRLGANARKSAERYSIEKIMPIWEDLIEQVIRARQKRR